MNRDRASDLTILLGRISKIAEGWEGRPLEPWIWHCPRCYGTVRNDGKTWYCGLGLGHPRGCGWSGEAELFTPKDAFSQAREAIEFLLAEKEPEETPPAACEHCGASAQAACRRPIGYPCLSKTC